jgi:RluA family pseudouridine synthase
MLTPTPLYEDEHLLVLAKPAGLLSHGADDAPSVLTWAEARAAQRQGVGAGASLHLVHRLDKETSGVLLLAKSAEVAAACGEAFRLRRVLKIYLAVCSPVPALRWLRLEQHLQPRRLGGGEFMAVAEQGLEATSEIEVLARGRRLAFVRVLPEQGRKHQVRVALASAGAPICGDFLYGGNLARQLAKRVMLHARALELAHPVTGQHLVLRAPLPADFRELLTADGCLIPGDYDRRHRSEPAARRADATTTSARLTAQARQVQAPRGVDAKRSRASRPEGVKPPRSRR